MKKIIQISKRQWENIGVSGGWLKQAQETPQMTIDAVQFHRAEGQTPTEADRILNRRDLSLGVAGVKVTQIRKPLVQELADYYSLVESLGGTKLGTVEVYENGAKNIFVKDALGRPVGFIRLRPQQPQENSADATEEVINNENKTI